MTLEEDKKKTADILNTMDILHKIEHSRSQSRNENLQKLHELFKSLTKLDLGSYQIKTEAMGAIADALNLNTTITTLALHKNNITNQAAHSISSILRNKVLTTLDLGGNQISDEGIRIILEGARNNENLRKINLSHCEISYKNVEAIVSLIEENQNLEKLDLSYCKISDEGREKLSETAAKKNKNIKIELPPETSIQGTSAGKPVDYYNQTLY